MRLGVLLACDMQVLAETLKPTKRVVNWIEWTGVVMAIGNFWFYWHLFKHHADLKSNTLPKGLHDAALGSSLARPVFMTRNGIAELRHVMSAVRLVDKST